MNDDNIIRIMSTPKGANYVVVASRESLSIHAVNAQVQSLAAASMNRTIASIILRQLALSYYHDAQQVPFRTPQDVIECDFCNNTESVLQCNATVRKTGCKEFWTESFYICPACRKEIGS